MRRKDSSGKGTMSNGQSRTGWVSFSWYVSIESDYSFFWTRFADIDRWYSPHYYL